MYLTEVYTSLEGLKLNKAKVKSMSCLGELFVEWITETAASLLEKRTPSELKAKEELHQLFPNIQEQVFFHIKDKSYFLDFFIPGLNIAIEVDGGYHLGRKKEDKERDELVGSIGIRTIRIKESRVMGGFLKEDFYAGLKKKKHCKKSAKKKIRAKTRKQKEWERFEKFKRLDNSKTVPIKNNSSHINLI